MMRMYQKSFKSVNNKKISSFAKLVVLQFYNDPSIEKEIPGTRGIRSGLKQRCQNPCTDLRQ